MVSLRAANRNCQHQNDKQRDGPHKVTSSVLTFVLFVSVLVYDTHDWTSLHARQTWLLVNNMDHELSPDPQVIELWASIQWRFVVAWLIKIIPVPSLCLFFTLFAFTAHKWLTLIICISYRLFTFITFYHIFSHYCTTSFILRPPESSFFGLVKNRIAPVTGIKAAVMITSAAESPQDKPNNEASIRKTSTLHQ